MKANKAFLSVFLACFFSFAFLGCAKKIIYQQVKIPVKCDIVLPSRPSERLEGLEYLKELLIYTELLEKDLNFCTQKQEQK
ncbi:hypothetical protein [Helicobacter pylori]|uniref:hypothetical protein n=1 Tax=Helicobacter pylori TaxID=210 RepID=UPI001F096FC4|nr:hypothetical protein [Helicobacter pylori]